MLVACRRSSVPRAPFIEAVENTTTSAHPARGFEYWPLFPLLAAMGHPILTHVTNVCVYPFQVCNLADEVFRPTGSRCRVLVEEVPPIADLISVNFHTEAEVEFRLNKSPFYIFRFHFGVIPIALHLRVLCAWWAANNKVWLLNPQDASHFSPI